MSEAAVILARLVWVRYRGETGHSSASQPCLKLTRSRHWTYPYLVVSGNSPSIAFGCGAAVCYSVKELILHQPRCSLARLVHPGGRS